MKILKKTIKECDTTDWNKTNVLVLEYTHKWKMWKIQVRDYNDDNYKVILKQLKVEVKNLFNNIEKWVTSQQN